MTWAVTAISIFFLLQVYSGNATFNDFNFVGDPNGFSLTRILECAEDGGERLDVPLTPGPQTSGIPRDYNFWLPEPSPFAGPDNLDCVINNMEVLTGLLGEFQNINRMFQRLNNPPVLVDGVFPGLCPSNNIDDLEDDETYIVDSLILAPIIATNLSENDIVFGRSANAAPSEFFNNRIDIFQDIFRGLRCRPLHNWIDLGSKFLPRFMVSGRCFNRGCSFPVRNEQMCRPDVSKEVNFARFPALRWDCCWERNPDDEFDFNYDCGWRRVNVPVLCDCDCACPGNTRSL